MSRAAVLGAGAWGTALANLLAKKGVGTTLWSYEHDVAEGIEREHRNARYLEGVDLAPSLRKRLASPRPFGARSISRAWYVVTRSRSGAGQKYVW